MKIVINSDYGGYSLSEIVQTLYNIDNSTPRNDPRVVEAVEKFGSAANGCCAKLKVVDIPDDVNWVIEEYDGKEWVAEVHRTWQ